MSIHVLAICLAVLDVANPSKPHDRAMATCYEVGEAADRAGLPVSLVVALAYTESRLNPLAASARRARGPLQVVPVWHCPGGKAKGCDLVAAGVAALQKFHAKYGPDWPVVLCHWAQGNQCYRIGRMFARTVLSRAELYRHESMRWMGADL
mgnify:CR=1 FL=1